MHSICRGGYLTAVALGLILLAGCGRPLVGDAPNAGTPRGTGLSTITPGHVMVTTDRQHYAPADTITVAVANGLVESIVAADHQSNCTTLTLERQVAAAWQPQNPCQLMTATRLISFGAGTVTLVQLTPRPPSGGTPPAWAPGTYRMAFTYRATDTSPDAIVSSANLVVG